MAEPDKRQIGDGSDNYGEAAKQMAKAAKEAGKETAKQAAVKGAEAGANAAAATVQAGVEGGKAVAEIAAGTAAGGPWGAILSAAWAMRHTLFKILVCICLFFLVIIVLIVSLPSVVTNSVFGLDGSMVDIADPVKITLVANETLTVKIHNDKTKVDVPKTGDDADLMLWISLLGLAAAGVGCTAFFYLKKRRTGKHIAVKK